MRLLLTFSMPFMISQTATTQKPIYNWYFKQHQPTCPQTKTFHILLISLSSFLDVLYMICIQDSSCGNDMDLYSITVHYLCCFIPFLIISTNLFSFWSQQATELAFSLTGHPFSLFNWFPLLIACQSISLTVLCTDIHVTVITSLLDCSPKLHLNKMLIFLDQ